ncbi:ankyrin repeat domain-containing protein [uncultured Croceitalea sp.]|uniref:ankyrin repeat domain-containing protein n=1 Tax=uncultured Croceitalea sp. TaxID=1798908 RepID=UPI003305B10B
MKKTILTGCMSAMFMLVGLVGQANENSSKNTTSAKEIVAYEVSAFCKAIMKGDIETVKKLIEQGENVNEKSLGMTPAHFAARYNKSEILQVLIDNGANLKTRCKQGFTVKKHAQIAGADEALEVINAAMKKK